VKTRDAAVADTSAIARINNEGIDDLVATFETSHRTADDVVQWLDGSHP
jgi:L-amino acid N-acyltransferase YncA